jgi:hypothetical protein
MSSLPIRPGDAQGPTPLAEPPVVAATWQERPAADPWCPAELAPHLGDGLAWLTAVEYRDADARAEDAHPGWRALAATRRGRVHAHAGAHREDACAVAADGATLLAVVSDGAGSSRFSRVGAEVTCREAARAAARAVAAAPERTAEALGAALTAGVAAACEALRGLAERAAVPPRDFRCTALAVALHDGGRGDAGAVFAAVQVGDGAVVVRTADGAVRVVGGGDGGEFSGEVACFVPDACADAAAARVHALALADVTDVLVATDGVEDPFYPLARTGAALFAQLRDGTEAGAAPLDGFQRQPAVGPVVGPRAPDGGEAARRLAEWLTYEKRGENDDRTLVALTRRAPAPGA